MRFIRFVLISLIICCCNSPTERAIDNNKPKFIGTTEEIKWVSYSADSSYDTIFHLIDTVSHWYERGRTKLFHSGSVEYAFMQDSVKKEENLFGYASGTVCRPYMIANGDTVPADTVVCGIIIGKERAWVGSNKLTGTWNCNDSELILNYTKREGSSGSFIIDSTVIMKYRFINDDTLFIDEGDTTWPYIKKVSSDSAS
jgi:hypothetical protein